MASQWVDDPSWGGIAEHFGNSLFGAAASGADYRIKGAQYRELLDKIALARANDAALQRAITAGNAGFDAMQAPPTVIPMPPTLTRVPDTSTDIDPTTGDVLAGTLRAAPSPPIGEDAAGTPNPEGILRLANTPDSWGLNDEFNQKRKQTRADAELMLRLSRTPEQVAQTRGLGQVTMTGVPTDQAEWGRVQTQLTGKMPTTEGKTPHNWSITDPSTGQIAAQGYTFNGTHDAVTGVRVPAGALIGGTPNLNPKSQYADPETARGVLANWALNRDVNKASDQDLQAFNVMVNAGYKETIEERDFGGGKQPYAVRKDMIPEYLQPWADKYNNWLEHKRDLQGIPRPAVDPAQVAVDPATGQPVPEPVVGGISNQRAVGPYVPSRQSPAQIQTAIREDHRYQKFVEMATQWNGFVQTANKGNSQGVYDNASDLNLIYGMGRLFDDRTGIKADDVAQIKNLSDLSGWAVSMKQKWLDNGGILPPEVRRELMFAGEYRMKAYAKFWEEMKVEIAQKAAAAGVNPVDVIPRVPDAEPLNLGAMERIVVKTKEAAGGRPPAPATSKVPAQPRTATPPDRTDVDELLRGGP